MPTSGRVQVAERGLTPAAVGALIPLMGAVGFEELGLVKALLKRFFSDGPWTAPDAAALSNAVGGPPPATDTVLRHDLAPDLQLVAGWVGGVFFLDVEVADDPAPPPGGDGPGATTELDLGATFDRGVVPEPTPNPRTIRFATGPRPLAESTSHRRADVAAATATDPAVAAVFAADEDVVDVLVAADFVAVSLRRPDRWPAALAPVLDAVAAGFAPEPQDGSDQADRATPAPAQDLDVRGVTPPSSSPSHDTRRTTRLDRAWADLAPLDPTTPDGLARLLTATADVDGAHRQVAAQLLDRAPLDDALPAWDRLLTDSSRAVRRAALDAAVGAEDERVRPLLERALTDADAWVRWKALHGLAVLGIGPSLHAIAPLDNDPDFRVRLEAANARRRA